MTIQEYLDLITSEHQGKPDFTKVVTFSVSPLVRVQELLASMIPLFDLDTPPRGDQLDIIGKWVGVSREIAVPIPGADVFFTWDDTEALGWDSGTWAPLDSSGTPVPPTPVTEITVLPDDAYLVLIRARIAANQWDGTTEGAYAIWQELFPDITILIQDYTDMSYAMLFIGTIDALTMALLTGGYIQLKPEGVRIVGYFIGTPPVFAWDTVGGNFAGWDTGNWAKLVTPGF